MADDAAADTDAARMSRRFQYYLAQRCKLTFAATAAATATAPAKRQRARDGDGDGDGDGGVVDLSAADDESGSDDAGSGANAEADVDDGDEVDARRQAFLQKTRARLQSREAKSAVKGSLLRDGDLSDAERDIRSFISDLRGADAVIAKVRDQPLKASVLSILCDVKDMLNDELVNAGVAIAASLDASGKTLALNSHFLTTMKANQDRLRETYESYLRDYEYILVPVHMDVHFFLVALHTPTRVAHVLNSLTTREHGTNLARQIAGWAAKHAAGGETWQLELNDCAKQPDGTSCGVRTVAAAHAVALRVPIEDITERTWNDAQHRRARVRLLCELLAMNEALV